LWIISVSGYRSSDEISGQFTPFVFSESKTALQG